MGDFSTSHSLMGRISGQKIVKKPQILNGIVDQMDLIDIYKAFHLKAEEYTFFSRSHGTSSGFDHMLGHKSSLGKFRKIEIISSIFPNHNATRLKINFKKREKNSKKHKIFKRKRVGGDDLGEWH